MVIRIRLLGVPPKTPLKGALKLNCHTRYGSFFICPLDKQKELPPFNRWDGPSQQFHLSCQRALPSGLPSKGNIPLKSLEAFLLGRFVPEENLSRELVYSLLFYQLITVYKAAEIHSFTFGHKNKTVPK